MNPAAAFAFGAASGGPKEPVTLHVGFRCKLPLSPVDSAGI